MNIYRFNVFIADYLDDYVKRTGDWDWVENTAERISNEIHDLINSGIAQHELFDEEWNVG